MEKFNPGKHDVAKLKCETNASSSDFNIFEFKKRTIQWGAPYSREVFEYTESFPFKNSRGLLLMKELSQLTPKMYSNVFGISTVILKQIFKLQHYHGEYSHYEDKGLRKRIEHFILNYFGPEHLFCIHTYNSYPIAYYKKTVIATTITNLSFNRKQNRYPIFLIISFSLQTANDTCTSLYNEKKAVKSRIRVKLLGKEMKQRRDEPTTLTNTEPSNFAEIVVGSADDMLKYVNGIRSDGDIKQLKASVKYVIVENADLFSENSNYVLTVAEILTNFMVSYTRVIFFAYSCKSDSLSSSYTKACCMVRGSVVVEIEEEKNNDIFEYIKTECITSKKSFLDEFLARNIARPVLSTDLNIVSTIMSEEVQKVQKCVHIIRKLVSDRKCRNDKYQNRQEKILIITDSIKSANFTAFFIQSLEPNIPVKLLVSADDQDVMEQVNFHFRGNSCNIVVVDLKSVHDINRGIVDAVIVRDCPKTNYFEAIFENEMERLISRDLVKIKLYILFDENNDIEEFPALISLYKKHGKLLPQFFQSISIKYKSFVRNQSLNAI